MGSALLAALVVGCATAPPPPPVAPGVRLSRAEYEELRARADRVPALEATIVALRQRVRWIEERVGLAPMPTTRLAPGEGTIRIPRRMHWVPDATGKVLKRDLAARLAQSPVTVLSFWATWCKPCVAADELKHVRALREGLKRQGASLLSVAVEAFEVVQRHERADDWVYPVWTRSDAHVEMLPRALVSRLGVGLPFFLVVGPDGAVRYSFHGTLDAGSVRDLVTAASAVCRR